MLSQGLSKDISAELIDKYDTPTNCTHLNVLPCNTEVLKYASVKLKGRDSALQTNQESLLKGRSAFRNAYEELL